jgi:hypothetical protein
MMYSNSQRNGLWRVGLNKAFDELALAFCS